MAESIFDNIVKRSLYLCTGSSRALGGQLVLEQQQLLIFKTF